MASAIVVVGAVVGVASARKAEAARHTSDTISPTPLVQTVDVLRDDAANATCASPLGKYIVRGRRWRLVKHFKADQGALPVPLPGALFSDEIAMRDRLVASAVRSRFASIIGDAGRGADAGTGDDH